MVSSVDGRGSISEVLQQQRQQVDNQQNAQRVKEQQQEVNRQAEEDRAVAVSRNDTDDRKGRSVDVRA